MTLPIREVVNHTPAFSGLYTAMNLSAGDQGHEEGGELAEEVVEVVHQGTVGLHIEIQLAIGIGAHDSEQSREDEDCSVSHCQNSQNEGHVYLAHALSGNRYEGQNVPRDSKHQYQGSHDFDGQG